MVVVYVVHKSEAKLFMYQTIEIRTLIKVVGGLGILVFLFLLWYAPPGDSALDWAKHISAAAAATASIIGILGSKWIFPHVWKLPPIQAASFPYVAGEWTGTISSNWPVVKAMMDAFTNGAEPHPIPQLDIATIGSEEKHVKVMIEADLFHVTMKLETLDKYSLSRTVVMKPLRKGPQDRPRLLYIYQNDTNIPLNTDSESHYGAAWLDVIGDGNALEGAYWTSRNWTKGLNPAGRIRLHRKIP
jgi:nitrate reductase NapE component